MHVFEALNWGTVNWFGLSWIVLALIALALAFDFLNGMNDAANSIATVVSTRVLSPWAAVGWAAFFNFFAFLVFHLKVAETIGKGIIDPAIVDNAVIGATLLGASLWTFFCTYFGLPISVSHSLIGGMVGAALTKIGPEALNLTWSEGGGLFKTLIFIVLAPLLGFAMGMVIAVATTWIFRLASRRSVDKLFRWGQLASAAFYSLGHGGNDAQKTMGIIFVLLIAGSTSYSDGTPVLTRQSHIPTEIVLACYLAMGLGTLIGGWAVIRTLGHRIIKLQPIDGFCAETGAAATLIFTIFGGIPASTTHTITGSIIGVGSARHRLSAVRWGVAGRIVWAWVLTIPGSAGIAAGIWWALSRITI